MMHLGAGKPLTHCKCTRYLLTISNFVDEIIRLWSIKFVATDFLFVCGVCVHRFQFSTAFAHFRKFSHQELYKARDVMTEIKQYDKHVWSFWFLTNTQFSLRQAMLQGTFICREDQI